MPGTDGVVGVVGCLPHSPAAAQSHLRRFCSLCTQESGGFLLLNREALLDALVFCIFGGTLWALVPEEGLCLPKAQFTLLYFARMIRNVSENKFGKHVSASGRRSPARLCVHGQGFTRSTGTCHS